MQGRSARNGGPPEAADMPFRHNLTVQFVAFPAAHHVSDA